MCDAEDSDLSLAVGTLLPVPNLHHVTGMLVLVEHVHQGTLTLIQLTSQLGSEDPGEINSKLEKLSMSNSQVALCCNELAASLLTVIKSTPCATGKELSSQVQSLSHEIARAGKNVNHLLKKRGVSSSSRRNSQAPQPQLMQSNTAASKSTTTNVSAVENSSKRGSLTVAQTGLGLDEKATAVLVGERDSRRKSHEVESGNSRTESTSTISTVVEHRSKDDTTPTISAANTANITDVERDKSSEKSSESTPNCSNSTPVAGHNGGSIAVKDTPVKTAPPTEETVNVRHSNATGQVISESPTHSPPHHTNSQTAAGNCLTSTANGAVTSAPPPTKVVAQTVADEEDSSVI